MSDPFVADLEASRELRCAIEIRTIDGERLLTGVRDLDEAGGYVVVGRPRSLGDKETTQTVRLSDIVSVSLNTDMSYE